MTIPILLSTGSLYNLDISTMMALAAETGFAGLELVVDWRWETHRLSHLERMMTRYQLPILALHSPFLNTPIHGWPSDPIARVKQSIRLAESLGAQTVVVHPPERWIRLQGIVASSSWGWKISIPLPVAGLGQLGRWLWDDLADVQTKTKIKITVENMPCRWLGPFRLEPHHFAKPSQLNHFPYLTLDTTHVGTRKTDLLIFYQQVKQKVAHIHLSNYNGREHQLLNDGVLPLALFLKELVKDQFKGCVSLELNTFDLHAEDIPSLKQNLQENLIFCHRALLTKEAETKT